MYGEPNNIEKEIIKPEYYIKEETQEETQEEEKEEIQEEKKEEINKPKQLKKQKDKVFPFIYRDITRGLVYDGSIGTIDATIYPEGANKRYEQLEKNKSIIKFQDFKIEAYGKIYDISLPILFNNGRKAIKDKKNIKYLDYNDELYDYMVQLTEYKLIDDIVFGIRQNLLTEFICIEFKGVLCFVKKEKTDLDKDSEFKLKDDQVSIIMMKEYIDGFIARKDFTFKYNGKNIKLNIGTDYQITIPGTDETDIIKGNYTTALRYKAFYEASMERAKRDFYKGEYPLLYSWQYDLLKRMGKRTIFTNIRRAGKTMFIIYYMFGALLKDIPRITTRPIQILYVGQNAKNMRPTMKYLKQMANKFNTKSKNNNDIGNIGDILFKAVESQGLFQFKDGKNGNILAEIRFVSDADNDPGVGDNCDLLVIDEVFRISERTRDLIKPFVENQDATLLMCSTMYKHIKKSRAYKYLISREKKTLKEKNIDRLIIKWYKELRKIETQYEKGIISYEEYGFKMKEFRKKMDNRYIGIRYTIDDNDKYSEEQKDKIKKQAIENDPVGYFKELYSRFPEEGKIFKFEKTLMQSDKVKLQTYKYIVVAYDPARSMDNSAVHIIGYNEFKKKVVLIEEYHINKEKDKYQVQVETLRNIIKEAKKYLLNPNDTIFFTMDSTNKTILEVFEAMGLYPSTGIVYTGGLQIKEERYGNIIKVGKEKLVEISQQLFNSDAVYININLENTIKQLENFYEIDTNKYEGVGEHDDFVNSMMMGFFFMYHVMGLSGELLKDDIIDDIEKIGRDRITLDLLKKQRFDKERQKRIAEQTQTTAKFLSKFVL